MKNIKLIKLINEKPYTKNNLKKDVYGIMIDKNNVDATVLFFNSQNIGDYAVVQVDNKDMEIQKEKLPNEAEKEILSNVDKILHNAKDFLEPLKIEEYDLVELLVEDSKYIKFGIHKGARGCVMQSSAVKNYIEVDFSGVDKYGKFYGDCISVKIEDLKVIKDKN